MPQVVLNFTQAQATRSLAATLGLYPKPPPESDIYLNPATGEPWTDNAWWKRCLITHLKNDVFRWEKGVATSNAMAGVDPDPDIAS
jgi:hypothetical protein